MDQGSVKPLIEPAHGKRKVLTIIFDPDRPDAPEPNAKYVDGVERVLFGDPPSAADYYNVVSGGRFTLENAGVLGPYKGKKPAAPQTTIIIGIRQRTIRTEMVIARTVLMPTALRGTSK